MFILNIMYLGLSKCKELNDTKLDQVHAKRYPSYWNPKFMSQSNSLINKFYIILTGSFFTPIRAGVMTRPKPVMKKTLLKA